MPMDDAAPLKAGVRMRDPRYAPRAFRAEQRADGSLILVNPRPVTGAFENTLDRWSTGPIVIRPASGSRNARARAGANLDMPRAATKCARSLAAWRPWGSNAARRC